VVILDVECLSEYREEQLASLSEAGPAALAKLRSEGFDPSQSPEAKRKMANSNSKNMREVHAWDRDHERPDPEVFVREILPELQGIPLRKLAQATGLSIQHCGLIRRGLRVPHPRHWEMLAGLTSTQPSVVS